MPKIIDFNVARKFTNQNFRMMSKVGLDAWNSPEMLDKTTYNEKVDLWGMGTILYFIITGEAPFCE